MMTKIRNFSYSVFHLLKEIIPQLSPLYKIHTPSGIKLFTRLRTELSHLTLS